MSKPLLILALPLVLAGCGDETVNPHFVLGGPPEGSWSQWARDGQHGSDVAAKGQQPARPLARVTFDPFVPQERIEAGDHVLIHYQAPLVDGDDVFMEVKAGRYVACDPPGSAEPPPCGADAWAEQEWGEDRYSWEGSSLVKKWRFASDWKPVPSAGRLTWEPVFHSAIAGNYLVVPGAGGTIFVVDRGTGGGIARINPFDSLDPDTYTVGPLAVARTGHVYYQVLSLAPGPTPWEVPIRDAWLVKVNPDGTTQKASFASLASGAPGAEDTCTGRFGMSALPWPPAPDAKPPPMTCGAQRPGVNVAPAVGPDGTVYTMSRAHFASRYSYLLALTPDLEPRWAASLRDRLDDGCGTPTMPPTGQPGGCKEGAKVGVDPSSNEAPAGEVSDVSTSSPTVAPDGTILYGAYTRYNGSRGHLMQFGPGGEYLGSYGFGWDVTPGIHRHGGGYSIVIKENHYAAGSYCSSEIFCPPPDHEGPFQITQLDPSLAVEWQYTNTNPNSCTRGKDGEVTCVPDHPDGFEWCINAPAVDEAGTVYANGEDGVLYAIEQGGLNVSTLFLREAIGAAYTPLSIDAKGRIYAENYGEVFVVGE